MVFPRTMTTIGHKLADDAVVIVKGRLDKRDDQPKLIAMDVEVFEGITDGAPPLRLRVAAPARRRAAGQGPQGVLVKFPGESKVYLHMGEQVLRLPDDCCVDAATGLISELRVLFGADCILRPAAPQRGPTRLGTAARTGC